jgi:hypothetical protein
MGPGKQMTKTWFGLEKNRKKISQIIKDYFYLPFLPLNYFMLLILLLLTKLPLLSL